MFRPRIFAMGVLVAAFAVCATSLPASAHDSLVSSTPESGERLEVAPSEVSLRFSDDVLTVGSAIIIADADGRDWVAGDVTIVGDTVSAALDPALPEAGYEIRWRVVSSDGHPISGLVPFTVGDGTPITRSAAGGDNDGAPGGDTLLHAGDNVADTEDAAQGQVSAEFGGIPRVVVLGLGGAAIALALAALVSFLRRRARAGQVTEPDSGITPNSRDDARGQHSL